jgi:ketosteroid isomerase-like protein
MKRIIFGWIFLLACLISADDSRVSIVVNTERAFAKTAVDQGIRTAFLAYLSKDSITFRPGPVNAWQLYESRPETPALLIWGPDRAIISQAGDMGFTTGPWSYSPKPGEKPVAWGQFATIWKKQQDGSWKAIFDAGTENPAPTSAAENPVFSDPATRPASNVDWGSEKKKLMQTQSDFSQKVASGKAVEAYRNYSAESNRLLRADHAPVSGKQAILAAPSSYDAAWEWRWVGGDLAQSGDLGYEYGTGEFKNSKASYFRVWNKDNKGDWKIVLDLVLPHPPQTQTSNS